MSVLDQVRDAMAIFRKVQGEFAEFGAADTEPSAEFHVIIRSALYGEAFQPLTILGWQLFESKPGRRSGPARIALNRAARAAHRLVYKYRANRTVQDHLIDECWRVFIAPSQLWRRREAG